MKAIRTISVILLIGWMALIFSLSAQNAATSSNTSAGVISAVIRIFRDDFDSLSPAEQQDIIAPFQFIVRKGAHFTAYAILGVFSFFTYITYTKIPFSLRLILISATCLLYSVSDEIHQTFVPGRSGEIRDVCIDFCGSILSIAFLTLIARTKKFRKYVSAGEKMRKNDILQANNELFGRNEELLSVIEELKRETEALRKELASVTAEKSRLEAKLNATEPLKALEEKMTAKVAVSKETEYGAEAIGRIVVKAAKCCNSLTASAKGEITKEQINLILGRTEVAKSEILKEVTADTDLEDKKIAIDALEKSAEDYFGSVMAQTQ